MPSAPLPPDLAAAAPAIGARLGGILRALYGLVAAGLLHHPRHVGLIIPLCRYITRTHQRVASVLARAAAGTLRPSRRRPERRTGRAPTVLPRRRAWLVHTLRHHAAGYASQLNHLLNEPQASAILAATPQAQRVLRPLCHLLGIQPDAMRKPPAPHRARPGRPPRPPANGRAAAPDAGLSPVLPAPCREPAAARPGYSPPPARPMAQLCPRMLDRWPFVFRPPPRPA